MRRWPWTASTDVVQLVNFSKSQDRKQQSFCDQWLWLSVARRVCRRRPTKKSESDGSRIDCGYSCYNVNVLNQLMIWTVVFRLWTQYAQDACRQGVLHGVRPGWYSPQSGHVPVHWRASQHVRQVRASLSQTLHALQTRRSFAHYVSMEKIFVEFMLGYTRRKHLLSHIAKV